MNAKKTKKIVLGIIVVVLLMVVLLFFAYQMPGVHFLGKQIHVNVEEEFYQYDVEGQLIGTIPVKFKGLLKETEDAKDFDGTVEVEGYKLQYVEKGVSNDQYMNAVMLDDREEGYIHLHIHGLKSIVEHNIPKFLHSDYNYNITICKNDSNAIIVRVGQLEKTASKTGGWHIEYPTIFYAVLAESAEAGAQLIASEIECFAQNPSQGAGTESMSSEETGTEPGTSQEETFAPDSSQETEDGSAVAEHLWVTGDVDGDSTEEMISLGDFDHQGVKASLRVDDEKVLDIQGQGELAEYSCRLAVADMDKDGQDEVLVFIGVPVRINDASFRYIEWEDGSWQEWPKVRLPKLEMTLDRDWQCVLTDGAETWVTEVKNPALRAAWFDEEGSPVAGPMQVGTFTENANHIIQEDKIVFNAWISVRDLGENGGSWEEDTWGEPMVTLLHENGQLVTDDALSQAMLNVLTDTRE